MEFESVGTSTVLLLLEGSSLKKEKVESPNTVANPVEEIF